MKTIHTPVMLQEVVEYLDPQPGKRFIDATLGAGGHTMALLEKGADVIGIDRDGDVIDIATKRIADAGWGDHFTSIRSSYAEALTGTFIEGDVDGVLFDLGVSSYQLDTPERGFSFRHDALLDMRMDQRLAVTAADLVNGLGKKELAELFTVLGEERYANKIASAIAEERKVKPIKTTRELAALVSSVVPSKNDSSKRIHPATRIFQALRMAVNGEREELKAALPSALSLLSSGGKLAIIAFQSLEDAIIAEFIAHNTGELRPDGVATPSGDEVAMNARSRSAKLYKAKKN